MFRILYCSYSGNQILPPSQGLFVVPDFLVALISLFSEFSDLILLSLSSLSWMTSEVFVWLA